MTNQLSREAAKIDQEERFTQFREAAVQTTSIIQEKVNRFPQLLKSTRGMVINTNYDPSLQMWNNFFNSLNLAYAEQGIIGVTYTQFIDDSNRSSFLLKNKQRYGKQFKIFPKHANDQENFVIMQAAPLKIADKVRGFDISSEQSRAEAARLARNSGQISTTGPISLLPTDKNSLDYLMLAPVHRSSEQPSNGLYFDGDLPFSGWVTLGFSLSLLVEKTLAQLPEAIRIQVFDPRLNSATPNFDTEQGGWSEIQERYLAQHRLYLSDQRIILNILPSNQSPRLSNTSSHNPTVLLAGMIASLLAALILYLLLRTRQNALSLASSMELRSQESNSRYQTLFDQSPEAIIIHTNLHVVLCNNSALKLIGAHSLEAIIGFNILDLVHEDSRSLVKERLKQLDQQESLKPIEQHIMRLDGSSFLAEVNSSRISYDGLPGVQVMFRDISALKRQRNEARIAKRVLEHTSEAIMVTNPDGEIILTNPAFTQLTGYERSDAEKRKPSLLSSGHHDETFFNELWQLLHQNGHWRGELVNRRKDGQIYVQKTNISAVHSKDGTISQFVCLMNDITEQKKALDSIRFQALHDNLTQLPNRSNFEMRAEEALRLAESNQHRLAILFIDLDGFKPINDQHGHLVGDQLLKTLASRLTAHLKSHQMVSRIGGDEFLVLSESPKDQEEIVSLGRELLDLISQPIPLNGQSLHVSASIGIAFFPENGASIAKLINQADKAMYYAKENGKGQIHCATTAKSEPPCYSD